MIVLAPEYEGTILKNWSAAVSFEILNAIPAVWLVTVPELPLPAAKVCPGSVTTSFVIVPATSVSVPKLVTPFVTPATVEVEEALFVIFPEARGVPNDG